MMFSLSETVVSVPPQLAKPQEAVQHRPEVEAAPQNRPRVQRMILQRQLM